MSMVRQCFLQLARLTTYNTFSLRVLFKCLFCHRGYGRNWKFTLSEAIALASNADHNVHDLSLWTPNGRSLGYWLVLTLNPIVTRLVLQ